MRSPYYTNEDIESVIADLENETENSMKIALRIVLCMLKDIRDNQIKNKQKVYTEPTDNKEDIIVGLNKQGVISDQDAFNTISDEKTGIIEHRLFPKELKLEKLGAKGPSLPPIGEKNIIVGRTHENPNGYIVPSNLHRKKLEELSEEDVNRLKSVGMFYELYPEAELDYNPAEPKNKIIEKQLTFNEAQEIVISFEQSQLDIPFMKTNLNPTPEEYRHAYKFIDGTKVCKVEKCNCPICESGK